MTAGLRPADTVEPNPDSWTAARVSRALRLARNAERAHVLRVARLVLRDVDVECIEDMLEFGPRR